MKKSQILRYGILFVILGVVIGLILSAELNWTQHSSANSPAGEETSQPAATETPVAVGNLTGQEILNLLSQTFADVAERVNPSVVTIFTETTVNIRSPFEDFFGDEFFRQFFNLPENGNRNRTFKQMGLGSGVIVDPNGIILTNNHVIKGADDIKVRLMDGTEYKAEVKGTDPRTDVAVIKIDAKNLPAIKFGDSDKARVGEWVLAIGSPLSPELAHTVTSGIISAKGRSAVGLDLAYGDFIQTDAAINPGNSGGPLVNLRGELIGINTAIATRNGGFMGIGFAIPSNLAKKIMNDILEKGRVTRGWLGVYIQDLKPELAKALGLEKSGGVLISSVQDDSPAQKAGLKPEDVIIKFNGKKVQNTRQLSTWVATAGPGARVKLTILRDGKEKEITVKLGELPEGKEIAAKEEPSSAEKIGITVSNITPELVNRYDLKVKKDAVVITQVEPGSPAMMAGLRPGQVILKINRKTVKNVSDFNKIMKKVKEGDTVLFYIQQGEARIFIALTVPKE